ncbi:baculoviral IAP repeat-containing protein 7-B-like [Babylonia areolata]|uniref:baculoviral IAP repeat-containing protein 7-B-like n=1 Tax=Babylonia areolata TaxID=304850 RepID=UPI003FD300B5
MAECGMYYAGYDDCVRGFSCGGGLEKTTTGKLLMIPGSNTPAGTRLLFFCAKGAQFVEIVQRKDRIGDRAFIKDIEEEINLKKTGAAAAAVSLPTPLRNPLRSLGSCDRKLATVSLRELEEEYETLITELTCKVCMGEKSSMVPLPCSHHVACVNCAVILKHCPVCMTFIKGIVKVNCTVILKHCPVCRSFIKGIVKVNCTVILKHCPICMTFIKGIVKVNCTVILEHCPVCRSFIKGTVKVNADC